MDDTDGDINVSSSREGEIFQNISILKHSDNSPENQDYTLYTKQNYLDTQRESQGSHDHVLEIKTTAET